LSAATPLAEAELPLDLPVLRLRGLAAGTYAVTLSAIDDMGLESRPSDALTIEIKAASKAIPRVIGGALPLPPGSLCETADGRTDRITLSAGEHTLQCTDAAGTQLPPLQVSLQAAQAELLTPSARAGKTAKLRIKLTGKGLPTVLNLMLPDGRQVPLKPGLKGWTAAVPLNAKTPEKVPLLIRDPDMLYGPPVAQVELTVKGGTP
jgi:hypothetical protein